jgi:dTMP kinase
MKGMFITFEGCEGAGKTTQADMLTDKLQETGHRILRVREPGGTRTGELIREMLQHDKAGEHLSSEVETLLFLASRAQLVRQVIVPALEAGDTVICDRYMDSTIAYQGYARGQDVEEIIRMNEFATGGLQPDMTFLLDLDVRTGFERIRSRQIVTGTAQDRIERESLEFHERVYQGYMALAQRWPARYRIVTAMRSKEEVAADAWKLLMPLIEMRG